MEQLSLFTYLEPNYQGSRDEIVRLHIENDFQQRIPLIECCGLHPQEKFKSCHEYFIICPVCGKHTKCYRHLYQAKQAWNKEEL